MSQKINRRSFIKKTTAVGASSLIGSNMISHLMGSASIFAFENEKINIAAVKGEDYFNNTIKAVDLLGGMKNFVSKGSTIGILANSPWKNPGSYTIPEVVLAVIQMCYDAGANEIISIENVSSSYWDRSELSKKFSDEIKSLKPAGKNHVKFEIQKGKSLKEAHVQKALLDRMFTSL